MLSMNSTLKPSEIFVLRDVHYQNHNFFLEWCNHKDLNFKDNNKRFGNDENIINSLSLSSVICEVEVFFLEDAWELLVFILYFSTSKSHRKKLHFWQMHTFWSLYSRTFLWFRWQFVSVSTISQYHSIGIFEKYWRGCSWTEVSINDVGLFSFWINC